MSPRVSVWITNAIFLSFIVVSLFYSLVYFENQNLIIETANLNEERNRSFAIVQELSRVKNQFPIAYQCHYSFGLSNGSLHEITERIPYSIYKKLRLGDTIQVYKKEIRTFGKLTAISRIKGNEEPLPLLENLERYFRYGFIYLLVLVGVTLVIRALGLLSQTYPSQQKLNEIDEIVVNKSQD
ncbi:hypothetical protein [Leptospira bandrabouensis]|uniref:Uncharacterized protein n=1 Tax=Leptospira bandrabouensis TaxID=2484903 RepID=A0A6H3NQK9_9LEPT|nr:hypothetical protein [Leptospira bandrabouensis]MCG6146241.1 hypothetical protein [Leptospira bandrabouensis]MCG6153896.1 hypothetical protein [Leptospira bandrabouensis]MCG6161344.1 hypothetical protein [Leptospira bandrabouensis]MCG6165828.1 hypothetical protein [Leptospira bandrabouensis]MCW7479049.1 hypothetical protein [Leptospira bandrabouensis]